MRPVARTPPWLVVLALVAGAPPPARAIEHPALPADAVEWLAPANRAVLQGGAPVRLAWRPGPGFVELGEVEEWEVFLSVDGGRTWAIRLTPHLSSEVRSVVVDLPNLAVGDGRLMLRMGDERTEYETVLATQLEIRLSGERREILAPSASASTGPPPSAHEEDVTIWAAGDRQARGLHWVARSTAPVSRLNDDDPDGVRSQSGQPWFLPEHRRAAARPRDAAIASHRFEPARAVPKGHSAILVQRSPRSATCRSNR